MDWRAYSLRESIYPSSQVKFASMEIEQIRSSWNNVLDTLEAHNRIAWIAYFDARLAEFDGSKLSLDFSDARKFSGGHEYSPTREKLQNSLIASIKATLNLDIQIEEI